jgi:hypothetical protein
MNSSVVSIVIPAYNQGQFLAQAVQSALDQSHQAIQVVVVDDGSTDDTPDVLRPFAGNARVRVIRQANGGLPAARNRGLDAATGEFVCFLDSDDYLERTHIERLAARLAEDGDLGLAYCDVQMVDLEGKASSQFSVAESRRTLSGDIFESLMIGGYFPPHAALIRRRVLKEVGGFDPELGGHADYELWLRVTGAGHRAAYVDERLACYRVYDGSMSRDAAHMRETREGAIERIARRYPARVGRALSAVQELAVDLHTANAWLRARWEPMIREVERSRADVKWSLIERVADVKLTARRTDQMALWDVTLDGRFDRTVMLHPPAVLEATIPGGQAGRLVTAVAIHPDAWGKPRAGATTFSVMVDQSVAATALLDPHQRPTDRRWVEIALDVPASDAGHHVLRLETQPIDSANFGWALFRDLRFI